MTSEPDDNGPVEGNSPACSMHEADDAYMGFAGEGDLIAFLNELLEAERAGARVALETARAAESGTIAELMRTIQRDEARWCAMLARHIKALGAAPSPNVGAFYTKAMAIADLGERVTFLNLGQAWVVESCARCYRAYATMYCTQSLPRCCDRTRPISPLLPGLRPAAGEPGAHPLAPLLRWSSTVVSTVMPGP
jgi:hypothetical protein